MNIKEAIEVLLEVKQILDENNITFFLDYGTLLGIVRNKGILPWDTDVDFGVMYHQTTKLLSVTNSFKDRGFSVWVHCNNYTVFKKGIPLTIACFQTEGNISFLVDYVSPNSFASKLQTVYDISCFRNLESHKCSQDGEKTRERKFHRITRAIVKYGIFRWLVKNISYGLWKICGGYFDAYITPSYFLEKFDQIVCYGSTFNVPYSVEKYLAFKYGEDWRTPKPKWSMEEDNALTHKIENRVREWITLDQVRRQ